MNTDTIVGTCSICGGPVVVPTQWAGLNPPIPICRDCGARAKSNYGPVIQMEQTGKVQKAWEDYTGMPAPLPYEHSTTNGKE